MGMKICKSCGMALPEENFRLSRTGSRTAVCNACVNEKRAESRYKGLQSGGVDAVPLSDPAFDSLQPGDVIRLMGRAKRWLESRGFLITLRGEYHKTIVKPLKFD